MVCRRRQNLHDMSWALRWVVRCMVSLSIVPCWSGWTVAQERLGMEPPRQRGPVATSIRTPEAAPLLPRPELPPLPSVPSERVDQLPLPRVFVHEIRLMGNTVFPQDRLDSVTRPYLKRHVTSEELETLRLDLTRLYVNAGYINSGAILPDQSVAGGVITLQIIEGTLTSVTVDGNRWFRDSYLRKRFTLDVGTPLQIGVLQARLQAVQQDDRITRLAAELRPGVRLGDSALHVHVVERLPISVTLEANNYQSPSVGAERLLLTVAHRNLTGHGDVLSVTYGRSEGLNPQLDTSYSLPLNARETTVSARYRRNDSSVVEERFAALDIESQSETYTLTLRHPFYRTLQRELAVALSAERLESMTSLQGKPFSFSPGARNGTVTDTALRLALEWLDRTPYQVIAVRSRFSVGVDILEATTHNDRSIPDGRFFTWAGQVQWARRLASSDIQLLFRLDVQLASEPLLPLEQLAIGGRFSVRGYRENQLVRDNGLIAALEAHLPIVRNTPWAEALQLVPFVDFGRAWNHPARASESGILASMGLGLRWTASVDTFVPLRTQCEIFWGQKLREIQTEGGNLQDKGLHLQVVLSAF